ncbi:sigma-70 family RNA polymerase sigma factor [Flindersiella endophytica]
MPFLRGVGPGDDAQGRPDDDSRPARGLLEELVREVARGDEHAFERLYAETSERVFGMVRRVLRNQAQAEEVTQEIFVEIWRSATRHDPAKGSALTWILTVAHRRAVDRVRSEQASSDREIRVAQASHEVPFDDVEEQAVLALEHQQVRRCLVGLTPVQHEAVTLAYYSGYTYREVATLLSVNLATVKTRMRDGLIRLRDCLGVERQA